MTEERVCASGHVLDVGKDNCSRCGGACVNDPVVQTHDELESELANRPEGDVRVDNDVDNENQPVADQESVPENGSTEPENTPEEPLADSNIQEGNPVSEDAPKVEDEQLPTSGLAVA